MSDNVRLTRLTSGATRVSIVGASPMQRAERALHLVQSVQDGLYFTVYIGQQTAFGVYGITRAEVREFAEKILEATL